jgi:hypothetical protein
MLYQVQDQGLFHACRRTFVDEACAAIRCGTDLQAARESRTYRERVRFHTFTV